MSAVLSKQWEKKYKRDTAHILSTRNEMQKGKYCSKRDALADALEGEKTNATKGTSDSIIICLVSLVTWQ